MRNRTHTSFRSRLALIGALVVGIVTPVVASSGVAHAASLSVSSSTSKYFTAGKASPVKGIKVKGLEGKNVLADISLGAPLRTTLPTGTTLSMSKTTGLTLSYGYTAFSGRSFAFVGTQADVNAALETLTVTLPADTTVPNVEVRTMFTEAQPGVVYSPANQHFYRYVQEKVNGNRAYADAANWTLSGLTGYLATITDAAENEFLSRKVDGAKNVWINGTDKETEGTWKFVGGPENGTEIWKGWEASFTANPGSAVNGAFTSWAEGEPNNWETTYHQVENSPAVGEDCIVLNKHSPTSAPPANEIQFEKWNDIPCTYGLGANHLISGYLVEFGTKTSGSTYDNTVDIRSHRLARAIPTQKLTTAQKIVSVVSKAKKSLPKGFNIFAKPKKSEPKFLCPGDEKMTRLSFTLKLNETGRYTFFFRGKDGRIIRMECGTTINKKVFTGWVSTPIFEVSSASEARPVITAYIKTSAVGNDAGYPQLNVLLRNPDGTIETVNQPSPPLPGARKPTRGVYRSLG